MRRGPRLVATAVILVTTTSCATTPKVPVVGRTVTVVPDGEKPRVKGELLAVGPHRLWIRGEDGVAEVRLPAVREVRVKRHGFGARAAMTWALVGGVTTGGALAGACASVEGSENCGAAGLVVAGAWLLFGLLAAPSMESSSRIDLWKPTQEQLRPFARFPQGLPEGLAPESLGLSE
jgi:hypothetical protein